MRPLYFVPDQFSQLLSDTGRAGGIYFSLSPVESEDLALRILCGRACVLLAGGMTCEKTFKTLQIGNIPYFEKCFRSYNGIGPEEYRSWVLSL